MWVYHTFTLCFWATVCKTVRPMLTVRCLSVLSVTFVYCGQTVGRIKMKLGIQVGLGPGNIVLDGDPAPLAKRGRSPPFSAHICCSQMAGWIKMPLGTEIDLSRGHIVFDGNPVSSAKGHSSPPPLFGHCLLWPRTSPVSATAELLFLFQFFSQIELLDTNYYSFLAISSGSAV